MQVFAPLTFAADNTSTIAEKVLISVRSRIPDTAGYEEFESSTYREGEQTVYNFNWSSNKSGIYKSMYVSALESGLIISYGINDGKEAASESIGSGFDRISKEEALNRAKKLIDALNPSISQKLRLESRNENEQFEDKSFSFNIVHIESGIPVLGDSGRVTVDINAERITGFNLSFTDNLTYPSAIKAVDLATAKAAFTDSIGLDLFYRVYTDTKTKTVKIFPVYAPKTDDVYIDAPTGKPKKVIPVFDTYFSKNESMSDSITSGGGNVNLTPAELKEIENLRKLLSRTDAEKLIRANEILGISTDYTLEEFSTRKISLTEDTYGHSMVFCRTESEKSSYIYVDIKAESGEVISFSNFALAASDAESATLDLEAKSKLVLESLAGEKHSEYKLRSQTNSNPLYFVYDRYVNGIRVEGNTASIEFKNDNTLSSYRISYTNGQFPSIADIVSNPDACNTLFDIAGYSLVYIPQKSDAELKRPDIASLIYAFSDTSIYLDAYTKNRINYDGTPYEENLSREDYTDIAGHYAEDKIKALRRFGIGFEDSEFNPDISISQKDFIILLAGAFAGGNNTLISSSTDSTEYYATAKRLGIITDAESSPDAMITRLQAAKLICRALKIEKYAQLESIFNCPFKDVTADKGYVTILWGLDILKGTGSNTFSPDDSLTRAQAAIIIYNAMENK